MACRRFVVSGRVQGVWYRASTRRLAESLGLSGHALNLPDGRVEVLACGGDGELDQLTAWLWQGPELAVVDDVSCEDLPEQAITGFYTG